jgi:hypothetical protein
MNLDLHPLTWRHIFAHGVLFFSLVYEGLSLAFFLPFLPFLLFHID